MLFVVMAAGLFDPFPANALAFLGLDLTCLQQCDLREEWTDQLVDQDSKKGDICDHHACVAERFGFDRHAECHACLRQERDAEIFDDIRVAVRDFSTAECANAFADRAREDVDDTDENDGTASEDRKLKLCTA